jgi:penicillin-binding protein 1A
LEIRPAGKRAGLFGLKLLFGTVLFVLFFLFGAGTGLALLGTFGDFPPIETVQDYRPSTTSKIYDRNNRLVGDIYIENRTIVPYATIPRHVVQAFVAAEDAHFFEHRGIDPSGILRAGIKNLLKGRIAQGGSTITQQTVKNLFLTPERSVKRKLKEIILAWRIERKMTKEEILFLYLNQIYLGDGAYGVEAASRSYFGKGVSALTVAEGAMLAGLARAPSLYSPRTNPEQAKARQRYVLRRTVEVGFLTQDEADRAFEAKLVLVPPSTFRSKAAYFVESVRLYIQEKYGTEALYRDAMRIYTTIDGDLQEAAHDALVEGIARTQERNRTEGLQGAILCLDPHTGGIIAMVGGVDFARSQFNRALQARRQPGSAFKPFVYAAALDRGKTLISMADDSPVAFDLSETELWKPRNYDGTFLGPIPLLTALAQSRNLATIRLLDEIGIGAALQTARALGIESPLERNLSIALGSSGVTLLEMSAAYAAFANGGEKPAPFFIREVRDGKGNVLESNAPATQRALSPETAFLTVRLMQEAVRNGTARSARGLGQHLAGKTGTTNENTDAWFIGFSRDLLAGVWVGFDAPKPIGGREAASSVALPIWIQFMKQALQRFPEREFSVPPGVTFARVDPATGAVLSPESPGGAVLPFRLGTVPASGLPDSRPLPGRQLPPDDLL